MEGTLIDRQEWILAILFLSFMILVWTRFRFSKRLGEFSSAFVNSRFVDQILREENPFLNVASVGLYVVYFLNAALFVGLVSKHGIVEHSFSSNAGLFFIAFLGLALFDFFKLFLYWLSALLYRTESETSNHVLNFILSRHAAGLVLFATNLLLAYSLVGKPILFWASLILLLLLYLHRLLKSIPQIRNLSSFNIVHFILYICTLEISPLLLGVRYFLND